jgi:hypothetical protein
MMTPQPVDLLRDIRSASTERDIMLTVCPQIITAWVFEDYMGMHTRELSNATEEMPASTRIARNTRKHAIATADGRLVMCPISLSYVYWWNSMCIGSPASVFNITHLTQYFIHTGDFRHPITREDICPPDVDRLARMLTCHGHARLASQLIEVHIDRSRLHVVRIAREEAAAVYEQAASMLLSDIVEVITANHRLHIFSSDANAADPHGFMLIVESNRRRVLTQLGQYLTQYAQYTASVIEDGSVDIDVVRTTIQRHTYSAMLGAAYECTDDPSTYNAYALLTRYLSDIFTQTYT